MWILKDMLLRSEQRYTAVPLKDVRYQVRLLLDATGVDREY